MNESPMLGAVIRQRQHERDKLQRQVDEFHAKGGKTQTLKPGEASVKRSHHLTREKQRKLYEQTNGKAAPG